MTSSADLAVIWGASGERPRGTSSRLIYSDQDEQKDKTMICWDSVGDRHVIGLFEKSEISRLRGCLEELAHLLERRFSESPAEPLDDPRLRVILLYHKGIVSRRHESEVFGPLHAAIGHTLTTLPTEGNRVELSSIDSAGAWLRALADVRVALALPSFGSGDEADHVRRIVQWLKSVEQALDATTSAWPTQVPQHLVDGINH